MQRGGLCLQLLHVRHSRFPEAATVANPLWICSYPKPVRCDEGGSAPRKNYRAYQTE